ncbi:MAG: ABC transporter permease [Chitinophagales bacterium]|nr:ABC transporter permease [Chitinophagales bacterium]
MRVKHIDSKQDTICQYLKKVIGFRAMIRVFVIRDIKIKYSQTKFRSLWFVFHPIIQAALYIFFFQYVFNVETSQVKYPIYVLSGLIAWSLFANVMSQGLNGLVESATLVKKIYFPRLIIPISKSVVVMMEVFLSFLLLLGLMLLYKEPVPLKILLLPFIIFALISLSISVTIWIGALSFKNRDVLQALPYFINILIWFTPVFIPLETYPGFLRPMLYFNPIAGLIDAWRACLFADYIFDPHYLYSIFSLIPIFIAGLWIFIKNETKYIDLI